MTKFDVQYIDNLVEKYTAKFIPESREIGKAYKYALMSGGKRMRPLLMLNAANAFSVDEVDSNMERLVVAVECIHTYSLVHDDLPAMDDDDFRRGKPTVHKVFGEAAGILCGDGLLTMAMQILAEGESSERYFRSISRLLNSAQNMVLGQADDLNANLFIDEKRYFAIATEKTGGILRDCLCIPAIYFEREKNFALIEQIGDKIGCLYQVADDMLDGKNDETSVLNFMTELEAKHFLENMTTEVGQKISEFERLEKVNLQFLKDFVEFNIVRKG